MISVSEPYFFNIGRIISEMGVDAADLAARIGVDMSKTPNPKIRLPFEAFAAMFDLGETQLGDAQIGLHVGEKFRVATFAENANILAVCRDMEEAAHINARYTAIVHTLGTPALVVGTEADPDIRTGRIIWTPGYAGADETRYRQITEYMMTNYVIRINWLGWSFGQGIRRITYRHAQHAPLDEYNRIYGCPVEFGSDENAVHFADGTINRPLPTADPARLALLKAQFERFRASYQNSAHIAARTEQLVREAMATGKPSLDVIADKLGYSPRGLRRRLKEQDTRFETIVKRVKMDLCRSYMADGLSYSDIAYRLGYSDQSAFNRAFKGWFGVTPKKWKA